MTTVSYERFLPEVLPFAHDCPQQVAVNAIRNACIEFCRETHWLTYEPDPMTVLADVDTYDLDYETGVIPIRLVWAKLNDVVTSAVLNADYTLTLASTPGEKQVDALTAKLALQPLRSSTAVDVSIYERWTEAVAQGALARLYDTPAQPFSDPEKAMRARAMFRSGVSDARVEVQRGLTVGPVFVQMRRF